MKRRLVWLQECVHGYEQVCSFGDCPGGVYEPVEFDDVLTVEELRRRVDEEVLRRNGPEQ